jgi:hypothetical protein
MENTVVKSSDLGSNCWLPCRFTGNNRCEHVFTCKYPEKNKCKAVTVEIEYWKRQEIEQVAKIHETAKSKIDSLKIRTENKVNTLEAK